jgi:Ca2+-binding RTX toxin-like protein
MQKFGTYADESLVGGAEGDLLDGGLGNDSLFGGAGDDAISGGDDHPVSGFELGVGVGNDWLDGGDGQDELDGGYGSDTLIGGVGNDFLQGGDEGFTGFSTYEGITLAVVDSLVGGLGDDTYVVDSAEDVVIEGVGEGTDLVMSSVGLTLASNVEQLILTGNLAVNGVGTQGANTLTGNVMANRLEGLGGNDSVLGGGGNDTLVGGIGNDTLVVGVGATRVQGDDGVDAVLLDWTGLSGVTFSGEKLVKGVAGYSGMYLAKNASGTVVSSVEFSGVERMVLGGKEVDLNPPALPSVRLSRSGTATKTTEQGGVVEYLVKLGTAPVQDVAIDFTSSDATEGKVVVQRLVFTATNWNVSQRLRIQGVDDYSDDGDVGYTVTGKIVTEDLRYNRLTVNAINLINADDGEDKPLNLKGTSEVDYLKGKNGADRIYGGGDQDSIRGGRGNDLLYGQEDEDKVFGDDGNDELYGGYDGDFLDGGEGADSLFGEQGADTLLGGAGNDLLDGGLLNDSMVGGMGDDTYYVDSAADQINDLGASSDVDTVIVVATTSYVLPANVERAGIQASGNANLTGNALNNVLTGNDGRNVLDGGKGNDSLQGAGGNDTLRGGEGVDWADFEAAGFNLTVDLATGKVVGEGTDLLFDMENAVSGDGDDRLEGSVGANALIGGAGSDRVSGGVGDDTLTGCGSGSGSGYAEVDTLVGGKGRDVFALGGSGGRYYDDGDAKTGGRGDYALVLDFTVGEDRLRLAGGSAAYFLGASGVSGVSGSGVYHDSNGNKKWDTSDELLAVVRSVSGVPLTAANVIGTAQFV